MKLRKIIKQKLSFLPKSYVIEIPKSDKFSDKLKAFSLNGATIQE